MPLLLIMRHAEAAPAGVSETDFGRVLTADGEAVADATGRVLKSLGVRPDAAVCSSARRTFDTASRVMKHAAPETAIDADEYLYNAPAVRIERVLHELLRDQQPECLLLVGHNPGIAAMMCRLAGESLGASPGTLCVFRAPDHESLLDPRSPDLSLVGFIQDGRVVRQDGLLVGDSSGGP